MRFMRALLTASCAIAIATILMVSGARADEYNKLTYLTFSGPVQVPGVSLPAGTYMFKLADPDSGRRAIQIWSQDGSKLYATLLTIPEQMAEPKDDPVVMFMESPSGAPHAIKSWFYPGDRTGQEFIYPKDQAMKIAAATNSEVLAYSDDVKAESDVTAMRSAGVGRIGGTGQVASTSTASTASADTTAQTTTAQSTTTTTTTTATATGTTATTTAAAPSASRTETASQAEVQSAPAASGRSDLSINQEAAPQRAVGTSGQAAQTGQPAGESRRLPATSSPLAALELLSMSTLGAALVVRRLRRRVVELQ
jgi:hypothetical protein